MPKHIYCAGCGMELTLLRKVVNGNIYELIKPHNCERLNDISVPDNNFVPLPDDSKPSGQKLDDMFNSFKFVQKLNDQIVSPKPTDNRAEENIRKEKSTQPISSAPKAIFDNLGLSVEK